MSTMTIKKFAAGSSPWVVAGWMALGVLGAVAVALLVPPDVLAGVNDAAGGEGGSKATKNFNKNGKSGLKDVGVPLFGATAMAGIVMGAMAKKFGMAAGVVLVSAVGLAISIDPEGTMSAVGNGIADLFK